MMLMFIFTWFDMHTTHTHTYIIVVMSRYPIFWTLLVSMSCLVSVSVSVSVSVLYNYRSLGYLYTVFKLSYQRGIPEFSWLRLVICSIGSTLWLHFIILIKYSWCWYMDCRFFNIYFHFFSCNSFLIYNPLQISYFDLQIWTLILKRLTLVICYRCRLQRHF